MSEETTATSPHLLLSVKDCIAVVTLNRPEAMNAFNIKMRNDMATLLSQIDQRDDVKVIVLTGAGDRAFCAGVDLKERSARSTEQMIHDHHFMVTQWLGSISRLRKPLIAAINGYCLGGGFEIALLCDMTLASDRAVFSLPEVTHGFFPGGGACQLLPRLVGIQMAKELILSGRRWDAQEAAALRLVNHVVPHEKLMEETMKLARQIAANPLISLIQGKAAINYSLESTFSAGLLFDSEAWAGCMHSDEWREKVTAFAKKEHKA